MSTIVLYLIFGSFSIVSTRKFKQKICTWFYINVDFITVKYVWTIPNIYLILAQPLRWSIQHWPTHYVVFHVRLSFFFFIVQYKPYKLQCFIYKCESVYVYDLRLLSEILMLNCQICFFNLFLINRHTVFLSLSKSH